METNKQPAYAQPIVTNADGEKTAAWEVHPDWSGFTKIELAALMIAQGILANSPDWSDKDTSINWVAINSVRYAKAVLEEANK